MTVLYANSFTGSNGAAPADFVTSEGPGAGSGGTRDIQSNKFRMQTVATDGNLQRAILPSAQWQQADGKANIFFTTQATVNSPVPEIHIRTSGDWSVAHNDSPTNGYKVVWVSGLGIGLFKQVAASETQLGSWSAFSLSGSTTYGMSIQAVGTAIKARIYTGSEPDASTWLIEVTDSAVAGPGQFQMAMFAQGATVTRIDWDDLTLDNLLTAATGPRPRLMRV